MSLVGSTVCTVQRRLVLYSEVHYHLHHLTLAFSSQDRAKKGTARLFHRARKALNPLLSRLADFGGVKTRKEKKKRATGQISY